MKCPKCKRIEMSVYKVVDGKIIWICPRCKQTETIFKNKDTNKQKTVEVGVEEV